MPTESVKWRFVFVDQMSGPARRAERGIAEVNRALRQSQRDEERRASASQRAAAVVQRAAERQQRAEAAVAARTSRAQAQASAARQRAVADNIATSQVVERIVAMVPPPTPVWNQQQRDQSHTQHRHNPSYSN